MAEDETKDARNKTVKITLEFPAEVVDEIIAALPIRYGVADTRFAGQEPEPVLKRWIALQAHELVQGVAMQNAAAEAEKLRQAALERTTKLTGGLQL